jgi:hypothetical protein
MSYSCIESDVLGCGTLDIWCSNFTVWALAIWQIFHFQPGLSYGGIHVPTGEGTRAGESTFARE